MYQNSLKNQLLPHLGPQDVEELLEGVDVLGGGGGVGHAPRLHQLPPHLDGGLHLRLDVGQGLEFNFVAMRA